MFDPYCEGPWREYPEHFGWDEFVARKDFSAAHPDAFELLGIPR